MNWITRLGLQAHPEGGWFRRIYTDPRRVDAPQGARAAASSIHYLLQRPQTVGRLHRNRSTILHYLQHGGPVEYLLLDEHGLRRTVLGYGRGQALFLEVPGGVWKASRLLGRAEHALIAEVVLPGFDPADHEFLDADELHRLYPQHAAALADLVR